MMPMDRIKGVKDKDVRLFARLGIHAIGDLLRHFPSRYQPYPPPTLAADLLMQPIASFVGTVQQVDIAPSPRGGLHKIVATIADRTGRVSATWFRRGRFSPVQVGQQVAISGKLTQFGRNLNFENPDWERDTGEPVHTRRMVPVYPLTSGLTDRAVRERVKWAVDALADAEPDPLPLWLRQQHDLWPLGAALRQIHFPDDPERLRLARRRLAFDELFAIQLVVVQRKLDWQSIDALALPTPRPALDALLASQPFTLTGSQQKVLGEILADVGRPQPMTRLLQGEVGSGKTAVAAAALFVAVQNGAQGSLMAPTEILSEQHYRSLTAFYERAAETLAAAGARTPRVGLLTGSTRAAERRRIYQAITDGEIDVLVGTQAVIQETVELENLGLAVVDEQHRFGVGQRARLQAKGAELEPHMLALTATPIPRTLALTVYGDLSISTIRELPPGRQPVRTEIRDRRALPKVEAFLAAEAAAGRQSFVVVPLVNESEAFSAASAEAEVERLRGRLPELRIGLVHGQQRSADREQTMAAFAAGEMDVLVATTVIEVGIDVPNASVMLIEDAERFGLAQLHQLRGRVGRGPHRSFCILLSDADDELARRRLEVLRGSTDGFEIAEADLQLRGAGNLLGTRQAGLPPLRVASLFEPRHLKLAERARELADRLVGADPELRQRPGVARLRRDFAPREAEGDAA
jgi:ATP-dependent DNA helicase RecG